MDFKEINSSCPLKLKNDEAKSENNINNGGKIGTTLIVGLG